MGFYTRDELYFLLYAVFSCCPLYHCFSSRKEQKPLFLENQATEARHEEPYPITDAQAQRPQQ
jgi:hypothetical protein